MSTPSRPPRRSLIPPNKIFKATKVEKEKYKAREKVTCLCKTPCLDCSCNKED